MKKESSKKALSILLVALISLSMVPLLTVTIRAATEAQIENAITIGVEWLATDQETDGSWPSFWEDVATTGLAVLKLEHRAYELGYASPFDPSYKYSGNVSDGLDYLFSKLLTVEITLQDHTGGATGTVDDPDFRVNGLGVYAHGHTYPFDVYDTGIVLSAISASGTPDRVVSVTSSPVDGWKYSEVAQDMVDWLAWAQADSGLGEGGWEYKATNNGTGKYPDDPNAKSGYGPDNSNSGYAVLGLGYAQNFGCTVPQWVKTELNAYIGNIQDPVNGDTNDGGSWYTAYSTAIGVNILKTGNLIFEMALVGDTPTTTRVVDALDYLVTHWGDASGANWPAGWDGTPAQYQAMFCAMKGLEYMGVDTFDSIDWYADFSDKIVAQQCTTPGPNYGSWQQSSGRGNPTIITAWALLTLEKTAPPRRDIDKKVYVELLRNGDFSNGLAHWMVRVENLHTVQTYDGPTWLATRPLGPGWTDVNLVNEVGRTNVLDIIQTVSDGDGDWTGAYQMVNKDVSGFSELYFEADGKAMFQSLAGDGWVGGEYPVHFVIQYRDVNGVDHDAHVGYPANPAWQQGFYYLAGNLPNEPYSNLVTQNVWFHYKSPNLMNLSPAPEMIKTVRLYSSGWAYQGRIDNAQLYGTPPSAELGDIIHVKLEVTIPSGETATVVDTLPSGLSYITGTFTVNDVPATPTITTIGPPPNPPIHKISYTITESGTYVIEFDCKVDSAYWEDREVCNIATATWYDEAGEVIETKEDVECFIIHAFEELHKSVGIPKKVKVIPAPVQFWREFIGGVTDIIVFDPPEITEPVALVRDYVVLHEGQDPILLEHLTWSETEQLPWERIDFEPYILPPNEIVEYDIPTVETDTAVLVRYTVAWASSQDVIEAHFINEAILESKSPQVIVGQLSNFDVHNDYHEPVDNFELELYGIQPSDIVDWFPGWGAPPQINQIPGGTEIIWMEPTQPVQPCEWVHFGLHLKPGVIATGIKAYWTQLDGGLTIKEKTDVQWRLEFEVSNPFSYTMTNVVITDRFGAEIEIDSPFPYSITHGTVSYTTRGTSQKVFLTWNIGDLLPGETARLILLVSTDYNPGRGDCNEDNVVNILDAASISAHWTGTPAGPLGYDRNADINDDDNVNILDAAIVSSVWGQSTTGHQEYTEPGIYELNSGATLKFIDPEQDMQLSAVTDSIYVTVLPLEDP